MHTLTSSKSIDRFKENLHIRYPFLTSYWRRFDGVNSFGLRHNEPISEVDICYFGCSFTYGEYTSANDVWTKVVDRTLNLSSNNFAVPGVGPDEMLLMFSAVLNFTKMKRAVFLLSSGSRQTIAVERGKKLQYINAFSNFAKDYDNDHLNYQILKSWFSLPESYHTDRTLTTIDIIKQLADYNNINLYWSSWDKELHSLLPNVKTPMPFVNDYMAQDKRHPGPDAHNNFAQEIIKLL